LYLDREFLAYFADQALCVLEIIREFDDRDRSTPAASTNPSLRSVLVSARSRTFRRSIARSIVTRLRLRLSGSPMAA
jgi:hypothetical protein